MSDVHPDVQAALDRIRDLRHHIADLREKVDGIRARRPSPGGEVIPEVDAQGRLTGLYLAPGTAAKYGNEQLVAEIMAAIRESTEDASRQYRAFMDNPAPIPVSLGVPAVQQPVPAEAES